MICASGCIDFNKVNNTWGEKNISLDAIKMSNNTTGNYTSDVNSSTYYVYGWINNYNSLDAFNVKIKVITYDSKGKVVAMNNTPIIQPVNIASKGSSEFYAEFPDPNKRIVKFKVEVVDAKAEY